MYRHDSDENTEARSQMCALTTLRLSTYSHSHYSDEPNKEMHTVFFFFLGHILFQFLCNLQQYCDSSYNKLNILQQKEFIDITKMNYIWRRKKEEEREGDKHTCTHALTHARAHEHTHTRTHARAHPPTHPHTHTHTHTIPN